MKNKIAVIHPELLVGGGSEAVALWIIETLKERYEVTLITMGTVDLQALNQCYGTALRKDQITIITVPPPMFFKKFDALRSYAVSRLSKKLAPQFDIMISSYNVMNFGRRGIQCIADVSFDDGLRRQFDTSPHKSGAWMYRGSLARMLYIAFAKVLSGTWQKGWEKNMTLVNSEWTGTVMEKRFGITARVVYPPVVGAATPTNWDERENGFVFLGRISPEKQIEKIIHILAKVREKNPSLHLHIIGRIDDGPYERFIRELCNKHTSWCKIETSMYGQEKWEFISKHKYGISARPNEPFGIAVAEMVTAGCIVFVPEGGGQTEIVANPQMIYHNGNDAVQKIEQVLKDDKLQRELSEQLSNRAPLFSVERFQKEINDSIAYFLNNYGRSNHTS